jgi:hypothetical protein
MKATENPERQLSYLQQCLSSDKRPLGLFIGAGCPMSIRTDANEPLIPDISGLTKRVRAELTGHVTCGGPFGDLDKQLKEDGRQDATIEDMLSHIRGLRVVVGKSIVRGLSAEALDLLDSEICALIHKVVDVELPESGTPYHSVASWADEIARSHCVEVFTSNYDLLMEQAFEVNRVPYFDGFAGVRRPFFDLRAMEQDELPPRWARLWKMHGSINWYQIKGKGVFRGISTEGKSAIRVIHPSHLKYQEGRRLPYLAMMDRFRAFLKQSTATLVICGYSFRDEHINEAMVQGLESNPTAMAFALLRGEINRYPHAIALARTRANLSVLARDGAVVSTRLSNWLEKDAAAIPVGLGPGLEWLPVAEESQRRKAAFTLGDFSVFGKLLWALAGDSRRTLEAAGG